MSEPVYILEMDEQQAKQLDCALEFYTRMRIGQWQVLCDHVLDMKKDSFCEQRDQLEKMLLEARRVAYPELFGIGHSFGVGKFEDADIAWELHEVLRHAIAWHEHPEGGLGVNFDKPMSLFGRKLAKCRVTHSTGMSTSAPLSPKRR